MAGQDPFQPLGYSITDPADPRYPPRGSGNASFTQGFDVNAPLGSAQNPGVGAPNNLQGYAFQPYPTFDVTNQQTTEASRQEGERIFNQGVQNNYMEQYLNTNASLDFQNRFDTFEAGYKQQNLGFDRQQIQLQGDLLNNQMNQSNANYDVTKRGLAVDRGGIVRDIGTENDLQRLRTQGFGLDREGLGLQGKRLDLTDEQIGQAEREQRQQYGDAIFNADAQAAAQGATVSEGHRRALSSLAQQLAFALEGDNRDRSNVMLNRGDVDIGGRRVNLNEAGAGVTNRSTLGRLNDQMAGNDLAGAKAYNDWRFGNNATWINQAGNQVDLSRNAGANSYNTQSLDYAKQRNQLKAYQDIRNLAIDASNSTGGKAFTPDQLNKKDPFAP